MKVDPKEPPREFGVGKDGHIVLKDCGRIALASNEQVTFHTPSGTELDVVKKEWGYYATPSLNGRLPRFGLRPALAKSGDGKCFVLLVESGKEEAFRRYMAAENQVVLCWLDDASLSEIEAKLARPPL